MLSFDERFHPPSPEPKQAVVLIHGMGEQEPMGTIRDFVKAVWVKDETLYDRNQAEKENNQNETWIKPDIKTGLQELMRITTKAARGTVPDEPGYRTDFFELYWADLNKGSTLADVENWILGLLWRWPGKSVPPQLCLAWGLLWAITLAIIYLLPIAVLKPEFSLPLIHTQPYLWVNNSPVGAATGPLIAVLLAWAGQKWLVGYIGCVVKYARARPENIAARKTVRERGLELLEALHDGTYKRVIIVSHSLGTILAHDLLALFWASHAGGYSFEMNSQELALLTELEWAAKAVREEEENEKTAREKNKPSFWQRLVSMIAAIWKSEKQSERTAAQRNFDDKQRALAYALRTRSMPPSPPDQSRRWLITDFITLGSPLTYSEFLLHANKTEFKRRKADREIAISPPVEELRDNKEVCRKAEASGFRYKLVEDTTGKAEPPFFGMSFPFKTDRATGLPQEFWQLHHAAPFAVVRWTNIYAPHHWLYLQGDVISGPLAPLFGNGVHDICLDGPEMRHFFAHTKYWKLGKNNKATEAVKKLRQALNLGCTGGV
jgi:hypothetical protein